MATSRKKAVRTKKAAKTVKMKKDSFWKRWLYGSK